MRHYPPSPVLLADDNILTLVAGMPYLIGIYGDQDNMMTIERATIQNQMIIETTDPRLTVIDIVVDRIGDHPLGNAEQYQRILETISAQSHRLNGSLDVLRAGIEVTLEYDLTREKDGTLVRRTNAKMFITNRSQYLDHTQPNPVTGPILTNFIDSTVKTITDRAYGSDRLICNLTKLTIAYVILRHKPPFHNDLCTPVATMRPDMNLGQLYEGVYETDRYAANAECILPNHPRPDHGCQDSFYHFEDAGKSICLHLNEIHDPSTITERIVVSSTPVGKSFIVEGGHRMEIKFSIWTASESLVNDTSEVYRLLDRHCHHPDPYYPDPCDPCRPDPHHPHHPTDRRLYAMIACEARRNDYQECDIRQLNAQGERIEQLLITMNTKLELELDSIRSDIEELKKSLPPVPKPDDPTPDPEPPVVDPDPVVPDPEPPVVEP